MQLSNTFEAIPSNISIGGIVEKVAPIEDLPKMSFSRESGFPRAKRRDVRAVGSCSIFNSSISLSVECFMWQKQHICSANEKAEKRRK